MKKIKSLLIAGALAVVTVGMAQEKTTEPVFEEQGELIKGTFYYEDGTIQQEGTYKDDQLHGKWISYNLRGEKVAQGQYEHGVKTGKWFFWSDDKLTEVDYDQSRIAAVNTWSKDAALVNNE